MNTIQIIARLTFREAIRRRIVLAALVLGAVFLLLYSVGFYFIQKDVQSMAQRGNVRGVQNVTTEGYNIFYLAGMYVVNFLGIATAALISADSLAGEISSGTIQTLVAKPVRRRDVVLGKWVGNAGLIFLYLLMIGGGIALVLLLVAQYPARGWLPGILLIYLNSLIIMSLTLAFSSSFSTLATGGAVFGAYGVAFLGGWMERIGSALHNQTAMDLGIFSSLFLPSEAVWNKAAGLMASPLINMVDNPFTAASEPSTVMMVYCALYLLIMIGLAVFQFRKRDL